MKRNHLFVAVGRPSGYRRHTPDFLVCFVETPAGYSALWFVFGTAGWVTSDVTLRYFTFGWVATAIPLTECVQEVRPIRYFFLSQGHTDQTA
jgi:hypothetical protein